jgi:carboxyvinyl-carboxyphosphonate phosphorylmutase
VIANHAQRFRELIAEPNLLLMPGAYDGVSARVIAQAGFPAIYFSGGLSASSFPSVPDFGTRTLSEAVAQVGGAVLATGKPILADAEAGFGSVLSIQRLVWEIERVGAAGIHIEDQDVPRRCGHYEGKKLVSVEEHAGRLRAAVAARTNPEFVIISRTDAVAVEGFEAAVARSRAYVEAGADVVFIEGMETREQLESTPALFDVPTMVNLVEGGKTPFLSGPELQAMGYALAIYPCSPYFAAVAAMRGVLASLRSDGTSSTFAGPMATFQEWQELTGVPEAMAILDEFGTKG